MKIKRTIMNIQTRPCKRCNQGRLSPCERSELGSFLKSGTKKFHPSSLQHNILRYFCLVLVYPQNYDVTKQKAVVIGSRIRERDKNNAEYYVGDYYPPIYWVPLVVCHSVCLWPINPHLSQQPAMGLGHKIFLGPFGAKKLKNDPY